jgi:hypothetical protein
MLHTALSFFSQHGFRSITSGPGEIEVFHHSRLIDGNLFYVYHLVDSLKERELFWVSESEKFSSLEDLMLAYPRLKALSFQTENNSTR